MERKGKIYIALIAIITIFIIINEYNKPEEINWFPSYAKHSKIPFGTYVFHEQMQRIFSKENIIDVERPPYEYLNNNDISGTYLFINNNVSIDPAELDELLDWTARGNTLAIASGSIGKTLLDTLNLKQSLISNFENLDNRFKLELVNNTLNNGTSYTFDKAEFLSHFSKLDTLKTEIIGIIDNATKNTLTPENSLTNVIKQPFGKGNIILSTFPQAFTNYFILKTPNNNYTAGIISYLDSSKPIYLDNHYKSGKTISLSPLYVFFKAKQLKWAYYIALIGALFYVLFEGKRKQRPVPIVKPLKNQTLAFTRTIANMYYENEKHTEIAKHKIQHFLEYIRVHLHLNTNTIDDNFLKHLAARSNNTIENTKTLFKTIESVTNSNKIKKETLETLNTSIEKFKSNNTWKSKI